MSYKLLSTSLNKSLQNLLKYSILLSFALAFSLSCSTKKDTKMRKQYHTITSHYNAYYNGEVSLNDAIKTIASNHKDNYTSLLQVFQLATTEESKSAAQNLERAVMKASLAIHKHSMFFDNTERVKWVYYSYLMIGKSHFYAHDYMMAKQSFKFVITKYGKEKVKNDAMFWLAMSLSADGEYDIAKSTLDNVKNKLVAGESVKESSRLMNALYADIYIKQKNYPQAISSIKLAVKDKHKKDFKSRLYFILGQLYEMQGDSKKAVEAFESCLRLSPKYEMEFNAKMNIAKNFKGSQSDAEDLINKLMKMLKDEKNKEYQDQIFYAIGEIHQSKKKIPDAISSFKKSVQFSTINNRQKAMSALKLADIYFDQTEYTESQAYYDSTMLFLPTDHPEYQQLKNKRDILTELVRYLIISKTEDSLQYLASLSQSDLMRKIDGFINAEIKREQIEREKEIEKQQIQQFAEEKVQTQTITQKANNLWYFYNTQLLTFGNTDFKKKWGQRKLEDNWRYSNKQSMSIEDAELLAEDEKLESDSLKKSKNDRKRRAFYLKDIPINQKMIDTSNMRIANALYNQGFIYKEKLGNYDKSIAAFEDLLNRYPKSKYAPAALYYLYQIYIEKDSESEAKHFKNKLLSEYSQSEYAKILADPDYHAKLEKEMNKLSDIYKETYISYGEGKYQKVIQTANDVLKNNPENTVVLSKFALLKALSTGKTSDTTAFINSLQQVVSGYPETEAKIMAENILARFEIPGKKAEIKKQEKEDEPSIYSFDQTETHMFVVVIDKKKTQLEELKNKISVHNSTYFGTDKLTVSAIPINNNLIAIGVSNFKNKETATLYLSTVTKSNELHDIMKSGDNKIFIISQSNYTKMYKSREVEAYIKFYQKYYN